MSQVNWAQPFKLVTWSFFQHFHHEIDEKSGPIAIARGAGLHFPPAPVLASPPVGSGWLRLGLVDAGQLQRPGGVGTGAPKEGPVEVGSGKEWGGLDRNSKWEHLEP